MVKKDQPQNKEKIINATSSGKFQVVTFMIEGECYGINILSLDEIIPMIEIKSIPQGPEFLEGVINLRGEVIAVVDLKKQFGHERKKYMFKSRIIVASFHSRKVGFVVDDVKDVKDLEEDIIQPSVINAEKGGFIEGTANLEDGVMIQLIAVEKILNEEALKQLSEVKL